MKGLIIDDEESLLLSTKMILEHHGHEIETSANPDITMYVIKIINPDFVIVDGHFGDSMVDGIDVARYLLKEGFKVGMYSGDLAMKERAKGIGIPFLSKLSHVEELIRFPDKIVE